MRKQEQQFFTALPPYLGGKRRLIPWIFKTLGNVIPKSEWHNQTFIDLFMGAGSVSLWAKAQGFKQVLANDVSHRSQIVAKALFENQKSILTREDVLKLTQPIPEHSRFIETTFSPAVFSKRHAQCLDQGFYWARQHPDPTKQALLLVLMWHLSCEFVAFASSLGPSNRPISEVLDGIRDWETINPKRFTDGSLKRLCQPVWTSLEKLRQRINRGVMGGASVKHVQEDAVLLLPQIHGDILYLDPPYAGTTDYESNSRILDALLAGELSQNTVEKSRFSNSVESLHSLLEEAQHIPIWLLSYGNRSISLDDLVQLVKQHAHGRVVKGFAKTYRHLSHVSKNDTNQELLVIAYPSQETL